MRNGLICVLAILALTGLGARARAEAKQIGSSPRAALSEFFEAARASDYASAATYLDLRHVSLAERAAEGPALARRVKSLLDRTLWVDLEAVSDSPEGDLDDGLPRSRERVGEISRSGERFDVMLERSARGASRPRWRIASPTLLAMAPLLEQSPWIEDRLPPLWVETRFLEIALWQWLALPLLAIAAWLAARGIVFALSRPLRTLARRLLGDDHELEERARAPQRLLVGVLLFRAGLNALALSLPVQEPLALAASALAWIAVVWLGARIADVAADRVGERLAASERTSAASLLPLGTRVVKGVLGAVAALAVLQSFGVNVTGLVAGLGIGGLAVALAAQKTVENLFGGVSLVADQPVRVGDFCRFGDRLGTVEAIGLRSTRVRTLDRTVVTIPNADFSALQLENYAERDRIWLKVMIGLRYETTPDQLRHVLAALRSLLAGDSRVDPDPGRVRFVALGAYSLDIEVFAYILTPDINEFLAIREELLLAMMDVVAASGTGFAFPSQTIYGAPDAGLDAAKARAAEAEVRSSPAVEAKSSRA
jgi:MscS family membrane protein